MSNPYYKKDPLTIFDNENWWGFLMREYPENYKCAQQYYSDEDPDLAEINRTPGEFDVNDYFTICQLPRISARKGIIEVDGEIVKRYGGFREWKEKRIQFEKLKELPIYRKWKYAQYYSQDKKCAWCNEPIELYSWHTHVDHVVPLYGEGTNEFKNLVLTCSKCNKHKGIKNKGYNDGLSFRAKNKVPSWIRPNYYANVELPYIEVTEREIDEYEVSNKNYGRKKYEDEDDSAFDDDLPL